jgi:hypothetical protein
LLLPAEIELYNAAGGRLPPDVLTAQSSSVMDSNGGPYPASNCANGINSAALSEATHVDLCHTDFGDTNPWITVTYPCSETLKKVVVQNFKFPDGS